ncbi:hypothetical protein ACH5RR_011325 [Cinchona calisaya]|uniref:Uncharacterized protein n=1 Tax=Cinchona calisaya TaxID=153742 RepID=A0ABD3A602_9GENT
MACLLKLKEIEIPRQWYNLIADLPFKPPPLHTKTCAPMKPEDLSPLFPDRLINQEAANDQFINIPGEEIKIPRQCCNLIADLPVKPPPPLHTKTCEPVKPKDCPLFPDRLIKQEATNDRFINIPEAVIDVYKLCHPTPLIRLVWYNAQQGVQDVVPETCAGQWGSALAFAFAGSLFGFNCELVKKILQMDPSSPGSLGIAISEAGVQVDPILLDSLFHLLGEKLNGKSNTHIGAVEPIACPSLTKGVYAYDFGDSRNDSFDEDAYTWE